MKDLLKLLFAFLVLFGKANASEVKIAIDSGRAVIENQFLAMEFDLESGLYSGIDKIKNETIIENAFFRLDPGGVEWKQLPAEHKAEDLGAVSDSLGKGRTLRFWYLPTAIYKPQRFLDVTVYEDSPGIMFAWGVKNTFDHVVRVRNAQPLNEGTLFNGQVIKNPQVLRSGAGAMTNFVENTWIINAFNGAMLTYLNSLNQERYTIVGGGLSYDEFARKFETHQGKKSWNADGTPRYSGDQSFITLSIFDPQGKRIAPHSTWKSNDTYYLDFVTENPFVSLEKYGKALALANHANPNKYDFPTLCGWMVSTKSLGEGKPINNSAGLVEQMEIARKSGITKYTPVAVRLEPDYYCYSAQGNTQQGWWDNEHWAKYGSLTKPYDTFLKFSESVRKNGGKVFTYFQASLPSNDFALAHPDWMLNKDISLLHVDHAHQLPLIRYDYSNPEFQEYVLAMWQRLRKDGVEGIKFDYPETAWARYGGFHDDSYTTTSAYRKLYQLCREGLGKEAYIHERILGWSIHEDVPQLDVAIGIVDLQRVWGDASHFEAEMASRMGLRWFKQNIAVRYYPDGKSFYYKGEPLSRVERRSFLTLIGLLSGRIELGTSFSSMSEDMLFDLGRLFPVLPNGKSFRPVDMLIKKDHPEVYVYEVNNQWKQVILTNPESEKEKTIIVPLSGEQAETGSIGLDPSKEYLVFDFWNQKFVGNLKGEEYFSGELQAKETLVYAFREKMPYPQILGTNRHVMCGMMELKDTQWNKKRKVLSCNAELVEGETLHITVSKPKQYALKEAFAENASVEIEDKGEYFIAKIRGNNEAVKQTELQLKF